MFHTDATLAGAGLFSRVWRSAESAQDGGFTREGHASVEGLAAGGCTVRLYPRSPTAVFFLPRRVEVPASGQATLAFTGESGGATLNQSLEGAETGRPGDSGTWVFEHVPPGRATLIVLPDDVEARFHLESLVLPTEGTMLHEVRPVWRAYRDDDG